MSSYQYYASCVTWPEDPYADGGLIDMIDGSIQVARRTLLRAVGEDNLRELEASLGYARWWRQGMTMAQDHHVTYHRSKLYEERVYYVKHSAIEHVFTPEVLA